MLQKNFTFHQVLVNRAITGAIGVATAWPMSLRKRIQPRGFQPKPPQAPCSLEAGFSQISAGFPDVIRAHFMRHHRNQIPKTTRRDERSFGFRLEMACERRVLGAFNQNRLKDGFKKMEFSFLSAIAQICYRSNPPRLLQASLRAIKASP